METSQILDLFDVNVNPSSTSTTDNNSHDITGREEDLVDVATGEVKEKGTKGWADGLGELWDEKAYEEEFDLGGFLKRMEK